MARICNIEKVDVGYIFQEMANDEKGLEGVRVTQDPQQIIDWLAEALGVPVAEAPELVEELPPILADEHQPPTPPQEKPNAFNPNGDLSEYDRELQRLINDNDRGTAHARLGALVKAGSLVEYNKNNGIKKLVQLLRKADSAQANNQCVDIEGNLVDNAQAEVIGETPVTQPEQPANAPTMNEVGAALQELAQANGPAAAMSIITDFGGAKLSDIPAEKYADVIALAKQRKAEAGVQ